MSSGGVYRYLLRGLRRARLERDNWTLFYGYCYGGRTDMGHVWSLGRCRNRTFIIFLTVTFPQQIEI